MVLLTKSNESIESAEILHDSSYYASSVHCSYYSCVQLMKHIALNVLDDFEDDKDFDDTQRGSNTGSHDFLIGHIYKKINEVGGNARKFGLIYQLRNIRINADYKEIVISEDQSRKVKEKSVEVNSELKTSFDI